MSAWTDLLDRFAATLDRAEAALEAGVFPEHGWDGDELYHPDCQPTPLEIERYRRLAIRADEVSERIDEGRLAILEELGDSRRRRAAARRYGSDSGGASIPPAA